MKKHKKQLFMCMSLRTSCVRLNLLAENANLSFLLFLLYERSLYVLQLVFGSFLLFDLEVDLIETSVGSF
jgi:hypothetical protein